MNTAKVTIALLGLAFAASFFFRTSRWFRLTLGGILGSVLTLIFFPGVACCLAASAAGGLLLFAVSKGLKEGRISAGWPDSGCTYYRSQNPIGFWLYMLFFFALSIFIFGAAIYFILHYQVFRLSHDIIGAG